jgi:hypothetical protein
MKQINPAQLRYVRFSGQGPEPAWRREYAAAFDLWKSVWSVTLKELDGSSALYSDEFTRQTWIGCIFDEDRCAALAFARLDHFDSPTAAFDSYFKVWNQETLQLLCAEGSSVFVGSNITVDAEYRGELSGGIKMKALLTGLQIQAFLDSGAAVMAGTMRCNKGMEKQAYAYGASLLKSGVTHHGVDVDLVAFYREQLKYPPVRDLLVERLWRQRSEFTFSKQYENERRKIS